MRGRADDIVPCLRCNKCHGRGQTIPYYSVCSVNPKLGIEHRLNVLVQRPGPSQKDRRDRRRPRMHEGGYGSLRPGAQGHAVRRRPSWAALIRHADYGRFQVDAEGTSRTTLIHQVEKRGIEVRLNFRGHSGDDRCGTMGHCGYRFRARSATHQGH